MGTAYWTWTGYPSGTPQRNSCCAIFIFLCSVLEITFGRCIVYTSVICDFWLLCWHFQTFLFTLIKLRNTYRIDFLVLLINKFNFQNEYKLAPLIILILDDKWPFPFSYTKMEKHNIHMAYNRKTYILSFLYTCNTMYVQACQWHSLLILRGHRGRDRMVDGFTTTYAISAYHHWCCEFESRSGRGVQHYVI